MAHITVMKMDFTVVNVRKRNRKGELFLRFSELTRPELESIIENANFTEEELVVFKMLTKGKTITEIAQKTNACNRTVSRRIEKIKSKINRIGGLSI